MIRLQAALIVLSKSRKPFASFSRVLESAKEGLTHVTITQEQRLWIRLPATTMERDWWYTLSPKL